MHAVGSNAVSRKQIKEVEAIDRRETEEFMIAWLRATLDLC